MSDSVSSRQYEAFDPKDKTRRESLELRLSDGSFYWLKHVDRHQMALSRDHTALALFFYRVNVVIVGRNLLEAARAIDGRNTAFLQQFDPARHDATEPDQVVVEHIELYEQDDPEAGEDERSKRSTSQARSASSSKH